MEKILMNFIPMYGHVLSCIVLQKYGDHIILVKLLFGYSKKNKRCSSLFRDIFQ